MYLTINPPTYLPTYFHTKRKDHLNPNINKKNNILIESLWPHHCETIYIRGGNFEDCNSFKCFWDVVSWFRFYI